MSKRSVLIVLLCVSLVAVMLSGCGGTEESEGTASQSAISEPTLEEYLDSDSKTGKFTLSSVTADGKQTEMQGEFWVDGRKFRYSLYEDGKLVRDITSPDGKTAYFVEHEGKYAEPSVASVDRYLLEFSEPSKDSVEDGADEQTGATRIVFAIKRLDEMAGADNAWYTEDVTYLVMDGKVIGVITRGDTPNDDGSDYDLDTSRRMFSELKVGEKIPAETFELPYPIKAAE